MDTDESLGNAAWIEKIVHDYIQKSPENTLKNQVHDKAWGTPLVGFSRGDDTLYEDFKDHVGPFHLTPLEFFVAAYGDRTIQAKDLAVISWVLPHNTVTKIDNRKEALYPSERWARGRIFGEETNTKLRQHVVASLNAKGYRALAPVLMPEFNIALSEKYGRASTWSERHAAYASGLGTFGLCDGLITPLGKAMRAGSVIAEVPVVPTPRKYTDHHEYCLFFSHGICGKCISRCPVGAITKSGKDKDLCSQHLSVTKGYVTSHYAFDGYGCGLCQTGVPCESKIPAKQDVQ